MTQPTPVDTAGSGVQALGQLYMLDETIRRRQFLDDAMLAAFPVFLRSWMEYAERVEKGVEKPADPMGQEEIAEISASEAVFAAERLLEKREEMHGAERDARRAAERGSGE